MKYFKGKLGTGKAYYPALEIAKEIKEIEIQCKKCNQAFNVQPGTKIHDSSLCNVCFEEEYEIPYFRDYKHL